MSALICAADDLLVLSVGSRLMVMRNKETSATKQELIVQQSVAPDMKAGDKGAGASFVFSFTDLTSISRIT